MMISLSLMNIVAALLLLILIVLLSTFIILTKPRTRSRKLLPSPPTFPFIGNLHQLSSMPHLSLHSLSLKHGPVMLLKLGKVRTLVISSPDAAREILKTNDHVFSSRPSLKMANMIFYGSRDVVFAPYGQHWKHLRKVCVNHLLSVKMVQSFRAVLEEELSTVLTKINSGMESRSEPVNMTEVVRLFMNSYVCRLLCGRDLGEERRSRVLCELIEQINLIVGQVCFGDLLPWPLGWLDRVSGLEAWAKRVRGGWDAVLDEIIQRHEKDHEVGGGVPQHPDFLDVLLVLRKENDDTAAGSITAETVKALLMDTIAGGSETTFTVLDWAMSELVRNPEKMKKLQDEVRAIASSSESKVITDKQLKEMRYLKAVIKEVFRLHPPAPLLVPRESTEQCTIAGYEIPKQTRVLVNVWAIGQDPNLWKAPEEFCPERFLDSAIDYQGHDFELIPFGAGRRICPGMQFAIPTVELVLATLVSKYNWELPEGILKRGS